MSNVFEGVSKLFVVCEEEGMYGTIEDVTQDNIKGKTHIQTCWVVYSTALL